MPPFSFASGMNSSAANTTENSLRVVCAWPVSGQYGPGTRILYYVLIAASVVAQKSELIKKACVAAALLFPAVAAIHGIVLAAVHVPSAVDMDIYGAFQLCSIGILTVPVTARRSKTYFNDPGRSLTFLWTLLLLAGMLSLTVEFFRVSTRPCGYDDNGNPISNLASQFPYGISCSLFCNLTGPISPIRQGAANNIYVIPAPEKLTFGTATLFAAGCCIPAILSLVSMWNKILRFNWKQGSDNKDQEQETKKQNEGATMWNKILEFNWKKRSDNKDKKQKTKKQDEGTKHITTEKPKEADKLIKRLLSRVEIVVFCGAVLAILVMGERNFLSHQVDYQTEPIQSVGQWAPIVGTVFAVLGSLYLLMMNHIPPAAPLANHDSASLSEDKHTTTPSPDQTQQSKKDSAFRVKVDGIVKTIVNYVGTAAPGTYDDSGFTEAKSSYPVTPGEELMNDNLPKTKEMYSEHLSSANSYAGSISSRRSIEESPPRLSRSLTRSLSPTPSRYRRSTSPSHRNKLDLHEMASSSSVTVSGGRPRRDTLEVPTPTNHSQTRTSPSAQFEVIHALSDDQNSPTIILSTEDSMLSPTNTAMVNSLSSDISSHPKPTIPSMPSTSMT